MRNWGDSLQTAFQHDIHCFHVVNITYSDGTDATHEDMATGDVVVNAYPIDWEMIYELSDLVTVKEVTEAAMIDAVDIAYYRQIVKDKEDFDIIFDKMKNNYSSSEDKSITGSDNCR